MSIPPQSSAAPGMRGMILMGFTIGIQTKRSSVWTPELTVILPSIRWDRQRRKEPSNKIDRVLRELQSNPRDHLLQCCSPSSLLWLFDPFFTSELVTRQACPCYSSTHTLFLSLIPPEFPRYCKCHLPITRQS